MATQNYLSTSSGGTWSASIVGLDTDSTTSSRPTISSTSTMTSNPYLVFNCSVPSGATVTAISAQIKMRAYSSSRTASVQLYNGTTSISTKLTVSSTSSSNISTINATSIPTSFTNLRLYFGASSTSSSYKPYVYGAHITITYTLPTKTVTYTKSGNGTIVQTPSGTSIDVGEDVNFLITPSSGYEISSVLDNNVNVTSRVTPHTRIVVDRSIADSDFTITQRGTASYGFTKQSAALTYASNMSGNSVRAGCTRFTTNFAYDTEITLSMKWNTSNSSDYVYVGNFDTSLSTSTTQPSSGTYQYRHAGSTTTFTYTMTVPAGSHYFDMYNYHARSNSSRTCTVVFSGNIMKEEVVEGVYDYDITNIQDNHTLVFTFGEKSYVLCTINYNGVKLVETQETGSIPVTYGGTTIIASVSGTKTLRCNGKIMSSDLVIGSRTLRCNGKIMKSDVTITVT